MYLTKKLKNKKIATLGAALALAGITLGGVSYVNAQNIPSTNSGSIKHFQKGIGREKPIAFGTISAINGTVVTLVDSNNSTTYTVDTSNAKILKAPTLPTTDTGTRPTTRPEATTIALTDLKVGDSIVVRGTISGTNITATELISGMPGEMGRHRGHKTPHVAGTVTAINGTSITVAGVNKNASVTYTVDASSAKILKAPDTAPTVGTRPELTTITLSDIKVGDKIKIEGTINDTSVTATEIIDGVFFQGPHQQKTQTQS